MSFLNELESAVYLKYVLKVFGVVILAVSFFYAWQHVGFFIKFGFIAGPLAWFVGTRFDKIYK